MNNDQIRNINDAWSLAMYFYDKDDNRDIYMQEYRRWITIWEILFNLAM